MGCRLRSVPFEFDAGTGGLPSDLFKAGRQEVEQR